MATLRDYLYSQKKPQRSRKNFVKENMKQVKIIQHQRNWDEDDLKKQPTSNNPKKKLLNKKNFGTSQNCRKITTMMEEVRDSREREEGSVRGRSARYCSTPPTLVSSSLSSEAKSIWRKKHVTTSDASCQTDMDKTNDAVREITEKLTQATITEDAENKEDGDGDSTKPESFNAQSKKPVDYVKLNTNMQYKEKVSKAPKRDPNRPPPSYQKGVLPRYLRDKKGIETTLSTPVTIKEEDEKPEDEISKDGECPPGHILMSDEDRKEHLRIIRQNYADLITQLNSLPVRSDSLRVRQRRLEIEKELDKMESGIKLFSRQKLYVKITS